MSWSEGRTNKTDSEAASVRVEKLGYINGALQKLSSDEDLHDELKQNIVKVAIDHWTGKKRLSSEEAKKFEESRSCIYVLQRMQMLRHAAETAGIASPVDHMLSRKKKLDFKYVLQYFGSDIIGIPKFPRELYSDEIRQLQEELKRKQVETNPNKSDIPRKKGSDIISSTNPSVGSVDKMSSPGEVKEDDVRQQDRIAEGDKRAPVFSWTYVVIQFLFMAIIGVSIAYLSKFQERST